MTAMNFTNSVSSRLLGATLACAALGMVALPASAKSAAPVDGHNAQNALGWDGTYVGTIPSASGTGYKTTLILKNNRTYTLLQDIEHKGKKYSESSTGRFTWEKGGSVIRLAAKDDNQRFFVSEGFVELQGAQGRNTGPMAKEYQLTKLTSYPGKREELLINPVSVKENSPSKGLVSFDGIWNMNHATQLGHRSLASTFVLNCKGKSYTMNDVRYYAQPHLRGKLLDQSKGKGHDIPVTREDKVMTEVMDTYCSR